MPYVRVIVRCEKIFSYVPYGNINDTLRIDMLKYFIGMWNVA